MQQQDRPLIGIVGGTGDVGRGLARRWARAGYSVIIGSRRADSAAAAASALNQAAQAEGWARPGAGAKTKAGAGSGAGAEAEAGAETEAEQSPAVRGLDNSAAAQRAELLVLTVPFAAQSATLKSIAAQAQGKILVDVTVPLAPPKVARVRLPAQGSAGQIAQSVLGEGVRVVSAVQNVAAAHLHSDEPIACDVLVCGNDKAARQAVIELLADIGLRGLHAGLIDNAAAAEALTSVLINLNKRYKTHAGIKITGIG